MTPEYKPDILSLEEAWQRHQEIARAFKQYGAQRIFESAHGVHEATQTHGHTCLGCIDERIELKHFGAAGSGILWGVDKTAEAVIRNNITEITSHRHCAAAAVAAKDKYGDASAADNYAQEFTIEVARKAGIKYGGHLDPADFGCPIHHVAGVVYYTDMPLALEDTNLPRGFVVTKLKDNPKGALKDVKLAVDIVQGDHGFGTRLNGNTPAVLIGVTKKPENAKQMRQQLELVQAHFGQLVSVDTVILQ